MTARGNSWLGVLVAKRRLKCLVRNNRQGLKKKLRAIPDSLIKYLILLTHIFYNIKQEMFWEDLAMASFLQTRQ
jgi:hypothetical protein